MNSTKAVLAGLVVPFVFAGCLVVPGPRGEPVVLVPRLPRIVVLGAEPYYVHRGYQYQYRDGGWYYSHSRGGPWEALPKDRYPKEVRFKDGGAEPDGKRKPGHQGR